MILGRKRESRVEQASDFMIMGYILKGLDMSSGFHLTLYEMKPHENQ